MNTATRPLISWTHYFKLRKSRQITERLTSLLSGSIGGISSTYYFGAVADFDPVTLVFGFIEPQMAAISASMLIGGVAWGIGNQVGAGVWRLTQTLEIKNGIDARDKELFTRLNHHRPATFHASLQNPVPDYYGEKITGVKEYRTWLKNQR